MIKKISISIICFLMIHCLSAQHKDVQNPTTRILFIFDCSFSMMAHWETSTKIGIARKMMTNIIDSLMDKENIELALRVYGHQSPVPPQDCKDTRLEVPFAKNNGPKIKQKFVSITPRGTTPIAYSLEMGANDFPPCDNCRNIIILITDGDEECRGDPCAVSLALQKQGIIIKPFIIGIGLDPDFRKTFECVGRYYDASNEQMFADALNMVITQALNSTTAQVNLLDSIGNPTETNVNMTFTDKLSGKIRYNYIHTINNRGNPDTLILDPLFKYRITVHTIPPVIIDSLHLTPGKHTIAAADAPQGYLTIKMTGSNMYNSLEYIVRKTGSMKTIHVQPVNSTEKFITGFYDLEVLTLPRTYIDKVNISQSATTTIQLPGPGKVTFLVQSKGYGSVYAEKNNTLEWIYNLDTGILNQTITLQPGNYRAVFRAKNIKESIGTVTRSFKVDQGGSTVVKLY